MDYQKIINFFDNQLNLEQKFGLKQIMIHVERITLTVKLDLKPQW